MDFEVLTREVMTDFGKEIVVEKKYKRYKDQHKNRLWVFQPQDEEYLAIKQKMEGLWA